MSSSSSRREWWKIRVVLTAMKTSRSCSSGGRWLGGLRPGISCAPFGDRLKWYRRERSPVHRRVRRAPARPRSRHCIGPRTPDSSAPESQLDGEGRLVRRGARQRRESGRHRRPAGREEVGVSALAPEAEPWQPLHHCRQPSTCSGCAPAAALGRLAPPLPPAQPEGRGYPKRVPEVAGKEAAEGTAPTLPAAAVGVEGRGPPALPRPLLPRDGQRSSFNTLRFMVSWYPASSFCSHCSSSWSLSLSHGHPRTLHQT